MAATPTLVIKNKRLKMSPGGLVTLPVSARRAIGMEKGKGATVAVSLDGGAVVVAADGKGDRVRVSPGGTMELPPAVRQPLAKAATRHYWFEAYDAEKRVVLRAY